MPKLMQKQRHITNTGPPLQSTSHLAPMLQLSTCDFASFIYMQIWFKEFSSSISSLSVPAPYFSVICYYEFWTQHVTRSNCMVSTDHFCCIFLPQMEAPQQPVTQHLKSTLGVTVSVHPLYSLWDYKRGGAFSHCTLQSSPKHTSQKGTQHNIVWCIQTPQQRHNNASQSATDLHELANSAPDLLHSTQHSKL